MHRQRQFVLGGLVALLGALAVVLLRGVLGTVFLAITVAYVLYPLQRWLRRRGIGPRIAASICTTVAFLAAVALVAPLVLSLYLRRADFFEFLNRLPATITLDFGEMAYTVDVDALLMSAQQIAGQLAGDLARAAPGLALELFLFALLIYGLLLRPNDLRAAILRPIPDSYHDVVLALHSRTRATLYGLYVLQAATAVGTFIVAWIVFILLGYETAFVLAALAGILQFIPIVGPSLLIAALAVVALFKGNLALALSVAVVGMVVIAFLPDAIIRPRLAALTTGLPASLYFIGFVGGVLSVGVVGIIAGPLIVALIAEAITLLSPDGAAVQQQLN
ncbi:MAG: AI-2E family transporter [Salinirussus sp.]